MFLLCFELAGPLATDVAKATEGLPPELRTAAHAVATAQNVINKMFVLMFWPSRMFLNVLWFFFMPIMHPLAFVSVLEPKAINPFSNKSSRVFFTSIS